LPIEQSRESLGKLHCSRLGEEIEFSAR
jgi:hypothetical protein